MYPLASHSVVTFSPYVTYIVGGALGGAAAAMEGRSAPPTICATDENLFGGTVGELLGGDNVSVVAPAAVSSDALVVIGCDTV